MFQPLCIYRYIDILGTDDPAFLMEIRYQLRYILANLYRRVRDVDLTDLILDDLVPLAVAHVDVYVRFVY